MSLARLLASATHLVENETQLEDKSWWKEQLGWNVEARCGFKFGGGEKDYQMLLYVLSQVRRIGHLHFLQQSAWATNPFGIVLDVGWGCYMLLPLPSSLYWTHHAMPIGVVRSLKPWPCMALLNTCHFPKCTFDLLWSLRSQPSGPTMSWDPQDPFCSNRTSPRFLVTFEESQDGLHGLHGPHSSSPIEPICCLGLEALQREIGGVVSVLIDLCWRKSRKVAL